MAKILTGGCCCGALRYQAREILDAGYCHCRICQRTSGAPVLAWAVVPVRAFELTRGRPTVFASSEHGERLFCGRCGTQILYKERDAAQTVDVNVATLDEPDRVAPQVHIWTQSRIAWFDTHDGLPRHPDGRPDSPAES